MLEIKSQEHYDTVLAFADKVGLRKQLDEKLRFLDEYAGRDTTRCRLFKDWAPHSFEFVMERKGPDGEYHRWFNGGLIYHGSHDGHGAGSFPTLAVTLTPTSGWSIHT